MLKSLNPPKTQSARPFEVPGGKGGAPGGGFLGGGSQDPGKFWGAQIPCRFENAKIGVADSQQAKLACGHREIYFLLGRRSRSTSIWVGSLRDDVRGGVRETR